MSERPDYAALIEGQARILERVNAGEAGLSVLPDLLRLAQDVLGARGAIFARYDPAAGRIIAATGGCEWALGRPVDRTAPQWTADTSAQVSPLRSLSPELTRQLGGRGLSRMLGARAEVGGVTVGTFHVCYHADDPLPGEEHHRVVTLLAAAAAQMYGTQAGPPDRRHDDRDLFVAVTSHELRNPVTVIKGYADTLTNHWESLDEPGRREAVRIIGQRSGDLARLVDRLLSAASDAGPVGGTPPAPFDLVDTLLTAAIGLPTNLRDRLTYRLPEGLPKAVGDRESLATLLTELATNADKYSPPDTPIEVTADADERSVSFHVSDRGVGVRPEHAERVFERFWQGESGDHRSYPSTGLGLYLVRRIVERQGGWVSLRPRDGGGTVAEVRLPRG